MEKLGELGKRMVNRENKGRRVESSGKQGKKRGNNGNG